MTVDPSRVQQIFAEVVDLSPADRAAAIDKRCENNKALRQRVESLLAAYDQPDSLLTIDFQIPQVPAEAPVANHLGAGDSISGRYELLNKIGVGGMGEVWAAKQSAPVIRNVAIKLIKRGMDSSSVLLRFEQERQALAIMDHPNIARILDAGTSEDGAPYFAMEWVKGVPITKYCDDNRLSIDDRLKLFIPVCEAVQHAHQKGILHRD